MEGIKEAAFSIGGYGGYKRGCFFNPVGRRMVRLQISITSGSEVHGLKLVGSSMFVFSRSAFYENTTA